MGRRVDPEPPPWTVSLHVGVAGPLWDAAANDGELVQALVVTEASFEAATWAISRRLRNLCMHDLCGYGKAAVEHWLKRWERRPAGPAGGMHALCFCYV